MLLTILTTEHTETAELIVGFLALYPKVFKAHQRSSAFQVFNIKLLIAVYYQ